MRSLRTILILLLSVSGLFYVTNGPHTLPDDAPEPVFQQALTQETIISIWSPLLESGNISSTSLQPGTELSITVNVTQASTFDWYHFNLEYHPLIVQFVDATTDGTILWPNIEFSYITEGISGILYVTVFGNSTTSGNGILLFTRFRVLTTGLSLLSVTDSFIKCSRCGETAVPHRTRGGCFNNRPLRTPTADFTTSPTPGSLETSEYMLGKVAVGMILPESTGPGYNWTDAEVAQTINGIKEGMNWWASVEPNANLNFTYEEHVRTPTSYEPIEMGLDQDTVWIQEVMINLGYSSDSFSAVNDYNNALRNTFRTDWAFTIFIVDSDPTVNQGLFQGGGYAHAYLGGPWVTMSRYSTWAWNSGMYFKIVPAHEAGHIFRATDEYNYFREDSGYLWLPDADGAYSIMNQNDPKASVSTKAQLGLVDCDQDGIMDLLDTLPALQLNSPPPTILDQSVRITGKVLVTPYPSYRPGGRDITIGKMSRVEYSIDSTAPQPAMPTDGVFDEVLEDLYFDLSSLRSGTHTITVKAVNSVGNSSSATFQINVQWGDVNDDCIVNIVDLALIGASFGKTAEQPGFNPNLDLNQDGRINIMDLAIVGRSFGKTCF